MVKQFITKLRNMKVLEMTLCTKCGGEMPLLRLTKYGYKHCVGCSSVERVGGVPITNHKTGNTIQVVPMEVANNINRLAARSGYGVCKGMKHN
jgi:ssDNA-binding Zn-finger/Zn-ribbon topoisomerase 1